MTLLTVLNDLSRKLNRKKKQFETQLATVLDIFFLSIEIVLFYIDKDHFDGWDMFCHVQWQFYRNCCIKMSSPPQDKDKETNIKSKEADFKVKD